MDSILISIKKLLGIDQQDTSFDADVIMYINGAFMELMQLGVGPEFGFIIYGENETWPEFLGDRKDLESVKTLTYLKVRILFDPPSSSAVLESIQRKISEYEWRVKAQVESKPAVTTTEGGTVNG